ncbi:hypothetical protein KFE98_16170 [bacterium SCSIO 12741]|nr:hypothetical protein KFE98_16170 [bacterium SCSIO 12741]
MIPVGPIQLFYREYMDQKSIFLSGIPMTYDTLKGSFPFESAGMFELRAFQNGEPLYVHPEKELEVTLLSSDQRDHFNQYILEEETGTWKFVRKDTAGTISTKKLKRLKAKLEQEEALYQGMLQSPPAKPLLESADQEKFSIKANHREFPELQSFQGYRFQVSDRDTVYQAKYGGFTWNNVDISRGKGASEFLVCFSQRNPEPGIPNPLCFLSDLVVPEESWAQANDRYEALFATYEKELLAVEKRRDDLKVKYEKKAEKLRAQQEQMKARRFTLGKRAQQELNLQRTFAINQFGIWNSDYFYHNPNSQRLLASYQTLEGEELKLNSATLVLWETTAIVKGSAKDLNYYPGMDQMIWSVMDSGSTIAVSIDESFNKIEPGSNSHTFTMELMTAQEFEKLAGNKISEGWQ